MRLSYIVIGILPDNDDFHLIKRTEIEGVEDEFSRWEALIFFVFAAYKLRKGCEIGLFKLAAELLFPSVFYFYVHRYLLFVCKVTENDTPYKMRSALSTIEEYQEQREI